LDTVSAISQIKEIEVGGNFGKAGEYDPEEFKKLSKID